jgi:Putative zinc- or iron-chelating domain
MHPDEDLTSSPVDRDLRQEVAEGLLHVHRRLGAGTAKTLESAAFLYALVELLAEKGLIQIDELDERKAAVAARLARQFSDRGLGVMIQDPEYDKYAFEQQVEIDCATRVQHCRAACCRLPFALSRQDLQEGIVRWDLAQPYVIAQRGDGCCGHLDAATLGCTIHAHRPVPCRAFDCRQDRRIWLDFEARIVNPLIERPDWPRCLAGPEEAGGDR